MLLAAVTSYADLVQNIAIADARRNNVRVLIQQFDATRERFRVGELTITDVSQAEARLEGARPTWCRPRRRCASPRRRSSAPSASGRAGSARCR